MEDSYELRVRLQDMTKERDYWVDECKKARSFNAPHHRINYIVDRSTMLIIFILMFAWFMYDPIAQRIFQ